LDRLLHAFRWIVAAPLAILAGWITWIAVAAGLDAFGVGPPDWRFYLLMAYGYLAIGFLVAGVATKMAPARRATVSLVMVGVAMGVGVVVAFSSPVGLAAGIVFGLSLLAGAVGYALRFRGFTASPDVGA
jgi:hypothetical protein